MSLWTDVWTMSLFLGGVLFALSYGAYRLFFYSYFNSPSDVAYHDVAETKRCLKCGCVNLKNVNICRECGGAI